MTARVDQRLCMGIAVCRAIAPQAFVVEATGQSSYLPGAVASRAELLEAAENCPVEAITVFEDDET